jgi:superfamily II DNA or RNA helicase
MVSEGVDIPRLRIGVYATAAKTPLIFRQIVGRFVRTIPGRPVEPSWLYIPADTVLREHAASIEHELVSRLRGNEDSEGDERERAERRETERSDEPAFVPLSADVAPQMTLFGPAPVAAAPAPIAWPPSLDQEPETDGPAAPADLPAFERRAMLRSERHRLVSEVRRREGDSHREINAWLNRQLGITSVEKASITELERSVELLVGRLTARR